MDSWTSTGNSYGTSPYNPAISFGTLSASYISLEGFNYRTGCEESKKGDIGHRAIEMNSVSRGMTALIIISQVTGCVAGVICILGCTNSSVVQDLKTAKYWLIFAFVSSVVTWALWLRASHEILKPQNVNERACRFPDVKWSNETTSLSFALYIIGSFFYLWVLILVVKNTNSAGIIEKKGVHQSIVFFSILAFTAIFVGAIANVWSAASATSEEYRNEQQSYNALAGVAYTNAVTEYHQNYTEYGPRYGKVPIYKSKIHPTGHSFISYQTRYGVFTDFLYFAVSFPYDDHENRAFICTEKLTDIDDAGRGLVQGGRVTLGTAITATITGALAVLNQLQLNRSAFWFSLLSLACCVISLLVWGLISYPIVQNRCCTNLACSMGSSFGLIAAGALFFAIALFHQAWAIAEDVFVLHPVHHYGDAAKLSTTEELLPTHAATAQLNNQTQI